MLIGLSPSTAKKQTPANESVFDVDVANFEKMVIGGSAERPILVEFWAPWCGPCKQLMPILERVTAAQNGKIVLAKVNIDDNPELAQAFRVQSVPMVVVMMQGQPVTAFAGVRPVAEIEQLVTQLVAHAQKNQPQSFDVAAALKDAEQWVIQSKYAEASEIYKHILQQEPDHGEAFIGLISAEISLGHIDQAESLLDSASATIRKNPRFASLMAAIEMIRSAPQGDISAAEQKIHANPNDCEALFYHAELCFAKNYKEKAAESLLSIVRINRMWEDGKARAQLLKYIDIWGAAEPASLQARRKLSALLFS